MAANPTAWLHPSREACCTIYFNWNFNNCMGITVTALGKYYPNWDQQVEGNVCLFDEDVMAPEYMMLNPALYMHSTKESCCSKFYSWDYNTCMGIVTTPAPPSNKWYVNFDTSRCVKDCPAGGELCGGPVPSSSTLYDTVDACCARITWVPSNVCTAESQGLVPEGSKKWYVNDSMLSCRQDCIGNAPCGGLAQGWQVLHADVNACCKVTLYWVNEAECIAASGGP